MYFLTINIFVLYLLVGYPSHPMHIRSGAYDSHCRNFHEDKTNL